MITNCFISPHPLLQPFVDNYGLSTSEGKTITMHSTWPASNETSLVFYTADPRGHFTGGNLASAPQDRRGCIVGLQSRCNGAVSLKGTCHTFIIQFKANGFGKLFRLPAGDFVNTLHSSDDVFGKEAPRSSPYAHLHLDAVNGRYKPGIIENAEPMDLFELVVGNQICYSVPLYTNGNHFKNLQQRWLPYYDDRRRLQRLKSTTDACGHDLGRIPLLTKRSLYFHAFDLLYKAFREYLQALFIAHKTYPLAYNKWIKYQITELLKKTELYPPLSGILSITAIESDEVNGKADTLRSLVNDIAK